MDNNIINKIGPHFDIPSSYPIHKQEEEEKKNIFFTKKEKRKLKKTSLAVAKFPNPNHLHSSLHTNKSLPFIELKHSFISSSSSSSCCCCC